MKKILLLMFIAFCSHIAVAQYCTPTYEDGSFGDLSGAMTTFSVTGYGGSSIVDDLGTTSSTVESGFVDRTTIASDTIKFQQGGTYPVIIDYADATNHTGNQIYIDFNDDGVFDTLTEAVTVDFPNTTTTPSVETIADEVYGNIIIPVGATLGYHRMRVRNVWYVNGDFEPADIPSIHLDPCNSGDATGDNHYWSGVSADYTIDIIALPACTGAPTAGIISGPSVACPSVSFTLGLTEDSAASGLTYVWKASTDGGTTFTVIAGATTNMYFVASQTVATEYKLVETCSASGIADSTPAFSIGETVCYCTTPSWFDSFPLDEAMSEFALTGYSGSSLDITDIDVDADPSTGYLDLTTIDTINLQEGGTYPLTVTFNTSENPWENQVWIDLNNDGIFSDAETVTSVFGYSTSTSSTSASTTLTVPITATAGYHRMRARNAWLLSGSGSSVSAFMDPCAESDADESYFSGDVIDFIANIILAPPCSGTPTAGTITGPASVCPGLTGYTLSLTGDSVASGLTFQWYSGPSGGTLTAISGATGTSYTAGTLTSAIDYRLVVTCISSALTDTTPVFTESPSPFYICYCGPNTDGTTLSEFEDEVTINEVSIPGTGLDNVVTGTSTPLYQLFYPTTPTTTATLNEGGTYTLIVDNAAGFDTYSAGLWIDYDHVDGFGDVPEYYDITDDAAPGTSSSITFTVPSSGTILTGLTGMRIRMTESFDAFSGSDACTPEFSGCTQDYVITIAPGVPCTGTPNGGTALASQDSACSLSTFALSDTGFTNGLGMTYQWLSRPAGSTGAYTVIAGATNPYYSMTGQTAATDYFFAVKCTLSGFSDTSTAVTVSENPFYLCYCNPTLGTDLGEFSDDAPINEVSISGTTLDNIDLTDDETVYQEFWPTTPSTTTDLYKGNTYTINVTSEDGFDNYNAVMWIDYNQNGNFGDPDLGEYTLVGSDVDPGITASNSFHVPSSALTGLTGMRIMIDPSFDGVPASGDACTNFFEQSTQDYVINIVPGIPCSGTPTAGTAYSLDTTACSLSTFNLIDTAFTNGLGVEYQWYTRPTGSTGAYTAIPGATLPIYAMTGQTVASDYIYVVKCDSTPTANIDTSNIISIAQSPFYICYCSPLVGTPLGDFSDEAPINEVSITGTTLNNTDFDDDDNSYVQFWPTTPSTTTDLQQAVTYTINVTSEDGFGDNYNVALWIDYDHSGTFDATGSIPTEFTNVATAAGFGSTASASFTVPETAMLGLTGLRVMVTPSFVSAFTGDEACTNLFEQSTEDYVINIVAGVSCSGTPVAGTAFASEPGACPFQPFTLTDTGLTTGFIGITYQWQAEASGATTFTDIAGATGSTYTVASQLTTTTYRLVINCTASGLADSSNMVVVVENPSTGCYCTPTYINSSFGDLDGALTTFSSTTYGGVAFSDDLETDESIVEAGYVDHHVTDTIKYLQGGVYPAIIDYASGTDRTGNQIFMDFNNDGGFDTTSEAVTINFPNDVTSPGVDDFADEVIDSIRIPATATPGYHRMRVRNIWYVNALYSDASIDLDPCAPGDASGNEYWSGVTVDYTVLIIPTACDTVAGLTAINVSDTGAILTWTGTSLSYEYVINNTPADPTVAGTATTALSDTATNLTCNTLYYVHVRAICGAGFVSPWVTDTFTTHICEGVAIVNGNPFDLQAYPNPAKDVVTVQVSGVLGNNRQVELTDVTGKVITKVRMFTDKVDVSVNNLASGIYLIRYSDDAHTQVIKVNKQ